MCGQHSAVLYNRLSWLLSKYDINIENCSFLHVFAFHFSSIFSGGQLTPFVPMYGRPWFSVFLWIFRRVRHAERRLRDSARLRGPIAARTQEWLCFEEVAASIVSARERAALHSNAWRRRQVPVTSWQRTYRWRHCFLRRYCATLTLIIFLQVSAFITAVYDTIRYDTIRDALKSTTSVYAKRMPKKYFWWFALPFLV